jgi:8-oxo-dGTP pyrophosphatase MutT (NUDIX family)/DNA-binding CsgD family transcriptional regulator/predicted ABC-type ATPase
MDEMDELNSPIADEQKDSLGAPRVLRTTDPDVFSDPESARVRARQLGCIGIRRYNNRQGGESWMPCSNESDYRKYNGMGPSGRRFRRQQLERDVREIIGRSRKKEDVTEEIFEKSGKSKESNYTKPQLRENLKRRIMAGDRGGAPGQWSARKAQLLAQAYKKAGGGYKGGRTEKQNSLKKWTGQKWRTSDGRPARRGGVTRRYLPSKAWSKLTPGQIRATNRKKMEASKRGEQFVANTEAARNARKRSVRGFKHIEFYEELEFKAIGSRIGGQLGRALRPGGGGGTGGRQARRAIGKLNRNVRIPGDQNPMTRPDADGDGILFDGTWREMPDPTPFSDFTVAGKLRRRAMDLPETRPAPEKPVREIARGRQKPKAPVQRSGEAAREALPKPKKLRTSPFRETEIRRPLAAPSAPGAPPPPPPDDPWEKYRDNFAGANNARLNSEIYKLAESLSGDVNEISKTTGLFKDQINDAIRKHRSVRKRNKDSFTKNFPATYSGINNFGSVKDEALEAVAEGKIKNWDDLVRWSFNDPELRKKRLIERATNDLFRAFKNGQSPDDDSNMVLGFKPSKRNSAEKIRTFADKNNLPKNFTSLGTEARRSIDRSITPASIDERAFDRNRSRMQRFTRPNENVLRDFDRYSSGVSGRMAGTPPGGMSDADKNAWKQNQWKKKKLAELGMESGLEINSPSLKAKLDEGDDLADGLTNIMNLSDAEVSQLWDSVSAEFRSAGRSMPAYRRADAPLAPDELASAATVKRPLVKAFLDEYKKYKPNGNFAKLDPDRMSDSEIEDLFNAFIVPELVDPDRPDPQEIIKAASLVETQDRMSMADEIAFGLGEEYMTLDFRRRLAERRLKEAGIEMDDPGFWDNLDNILNDPNAPIDRANNGINEPSGIDGRSISEITDPDDFLAWLSNGGGRSGGGGIIEGPNGPMDEEGWVNWGRRIFDEMNDAGEKYVSGEAYIGKGLDELEAEAKEWNIIGYEQGWLEMPPNVRIYDDPETGEKIIEMDFDKPGAEDIINTPTGTSISRGGNRLEWYEDEFGYLDTDEVWGEDPSAAGVDPEDSSTWGNLDGNVDENGVLLPLDEENLPQELWSIFTQRDWYDLQDTHVAQRYTAVPPEITDPKRRLGGRTSRGIQADGKPFSDVTVPMDIEWDMLLPAFEEAYGPLPRKADGSIDTSALPSGTYAAAGTGVARGNPFADFSADQAAKKFRDAANEQRDHLLGDIQQSPTKEGSKQFRARLWALFQSGQDPEEIAFDEMVLGWFEQDSSGRYVGHSGPHLVTQALKKHAVEMGIPDSQFKQLEKAANAAFQNRYAAHRKKVLDRVRRTLNERVMAGPGRTPSQESIAEIDFRITKWREFKEKMAKAYDQSRAQEAGLRYMIVSMLATRPLPERKRQIGFDDMGNPIFSNGWDPAVESLSRYKNRIRRWNREFIGYVERDDDGNIVDERKGIVQQMAEQLRLLTIREGRDGMSGMSAFVVGGGRGTPGLADAQIDALQQIKQEIQSMQQEAGRLGVSGFMRAGTSILDEAQERAAIAGKNIALGRYRRKSPNLLRNYDSPDFDVNKKVRNAFSGTTKSVRNLIAGDEDGPKKLSETRAFAYLTPREKNLARAIDSVPKAHIYLPSNPVRRNREEVGSIPDERQSLINRLSNTPAKPLNIQYGISGFMGGINPATRGNRLRERNSFRRGRFKNIEGLPRPKYRLEVQEREDTIFGKGKGLYVVDDATGNVIDGPFDTPAIAIKVLNDVYRNNWPEPWLQDPLLRSAILTSGMSELTHRFHTSDSVKMSDILSASNGWVYKKDDGKMQEVADSVFLRKNRETGQMEIMMVQRGDGPHIGEETGAWVLPGGFRDADEDRTNTAIRELLEETGIDVSAIDVERRNMGNIQANDWDIRWSGGVSVDGQKFRVPDDYEEAIDFAAGDDAKKAEWIPVEEIANGNIPVGFGHLAWIRIAMTDEVGDDEDGLLERLSALETLGRSRNQELIQYINTRRKNHNAGVRKRNAAIRASNKGKPKSERQELEKIVPLFKTGSLGQPEKIYDHYDPDAYLGIRARNRLNEKRGLPRLTPEEEKRHRDNSGEIARPGASGKMTTRNGFAKMGYGDVTRRSAYLANNGSSIDEIAQKLQEMDPTVTTESVAKSLKSLGIKAGETSSPVSDIERAVYMATAHDRMSISAAAKKYGLSQDEIFDIQKKYQSVLEDREPSINKVYRGILSDNSPLKRQDTANMMRRLDGASIEEMSSLLDMDENKYRAYEDKLFEKIRNSNPEAFSSKTKHIGNMDQHRADQLIYMMLNHEGRTAGSVARSLGITSDLVDSRAKRYEQWLDSSRQMPRVALRSTLAEFGDAVLSPGELRMMRRLADGESITDFAERRKISPRRAMHMVNKAMDNLERASLANSNKWSRRNNILESMPKQWMNPIFTRDMGRENTIGVSGKIKSPSVKNTAEANEWNKKYRSYASADIETLREAAIAAAETRRNNIAKSNTGFIFDDFDADSNITLAIGFYVRKRIEQAELNASSHIRKEFFEKGKVAAPDTTAREINKALSEMSNELWMKKDQLRGIEKMVDSLDEVGYPYRSWPKEEWARYKNPVELMDRYEIWTDEGQQRYLDDGFYLPVTGNELEDFIFMANEKNGVSGQMSAARPFVGEDEKIIGGEPYVWNGNEWIPDYEKQNNVLPSPFSEVNNPELSGKWTINKNGDFINNQNRSTIKNPLGENGEDWNGVAGRMSKPKPEVQKRIKQVAKLRKDGLTNRQIAEKTGLRLEQVAQYIVQARQQGIELPDVRGRTVEATEAKYQAVRRLQQQGYDTGEIARKLGLSRRDVVNAKLAATPKRTRKRQADVKAAEKRRKSAAKAKKKINKSTPSGGVSGRMSSSMPPLDDTLEKRLPGFDPDSLPSDYDSSFLTSTNPRSTLSWYAAQPNEPFVPVTATFGGTSKIVDWRHDEVYVPIVSALVNAVRKRTGKKRFISVGGAPGSGKTTDRKNGLNQIPSTDDALHLDADEIKTLIPEARALHAAGNLNWANTVHEESRIIVDMALQQGIQDGHSIVYDSTGQFNSGFGTLQAARDNGYEIVAHYNVATPAKLEAARLKRQQTDPRNIPSSLASSVISTNRNIMPKVADFADEFYLWDADNETGARTLLARKKKGGQLEILDIRAYAHADFDDTNQTIKKGGRPDIKMSERGVPRDSSQGDILDDYEKGMTVAEIAKARKMSESHVFKTVTETVIDPNMKGYRPPAPQPKKEVEAFITDDELENSWNALSDTEQQLVRDVINKTPGAMDEFNKTNIPMDMIIWAAQGGVSGKMTAFPIDGFKPYRSPEERSKKLPTFRGKPWKDVRPTLDGQPWPFKGQAKQFDKKGPPGLSYFKGTGNGLKPGQWVDCLLWRDEKGILKGIAYHYPQDLPLEKKGNLNIFISPDSKRQGIASKLVAEAIKRYNVDLRQQRYSAEGAAFINDFVRNLPENKEEFGVSGKMAAAISKEKRAEIDEYIKNNRSESDNTIGKKLGVSRAVVQQRRSLLGIPSAYRMKTPPELVSQIEEYIKNNQNEPNSSIAKKFGVSNNIVTNSRVSLGLPSSPLGNLSPELISKIDKRITQHPDHSDNHIARKLGVDKDKVAERRKLLGIPKPKKDTGLLARLSAEKISAIDAELKRDPDQFTKDIARKLGVSVSNVSARRNVLNLPAALKGRPVISDEKYRQIDEYIKNNPDEANNSIARKFGVSSPTIGTRRRSLGLVAYPTAKEREELVGNITGPRMIPKETEQKVVRAYLEGEKMLEIAKKFNISKTSIDRILERSGVPRRKKIDKSGEGTSPGVSGKMGVQKRFADRNEKIIEQYKNGTSLAEIAKSVGTTRSAVENVLNMARKRGLIGRPRSGVAKSEDIPRNMKIVELYESGKGYAEIAKELGLTTNVVYNAVLKSGKMRRPKKRGTSGR